MGRNRERRLIKREKIGREGEGKKLRRGREENEISDKRIRVYTPITL